MELRYFLKSATFLLVFSFLVSCGAPQKVNESPSKSNFEYALPNGFEIAQSKPIKDDNIAIIARKDSLFVFGLSKDSGTKSFVKMSQPFEAKAVKFAGERQWGCKLGDSFGYTVSFETDAPGFDSNFIKVFDENLNEIPNDLGSGFVPRELEDVDFDNNFDLIAIDLRWESYTDVFLSQPFTQRICRFEDGKFIDDPLPYKEQFEAGRKAFMELMNKTSNQQDALYYAVCLVLVYDSLGKAQEGLAGFKIMLPQFTQPAVSKNAKDLIADFEKQSENKQKLHPILWKERQSLAWSPLPFK